MVHMNFAHVFSLNIEKFAITRFSAVADTLLALFWFGECEKHLLRPQKCISSNRIGLVKNRASMLTYRPKCITEIG